MILVGIEIIQAGIDEGRIKGSIRSTLQSRERFGYKRLYDEILYKTDVYREILFPRRSIVDMEHSKSQTIRYVPCRDRICFSRIKLLF